MRTLLFDIDGTLIDSAGAGRDALNQALRQAFGSEPTEPIVFGGRTDRSLLSEMLRVHGHDVSESNFSQFRHSFVQCMPISLKKFSGRVLPGVPELLGHLAKLDQFRLWCMTGNLVETAHSKLSHFGLDHYFEHIVGGDHDEDRRDLARRARADLAAMHQTVAPRDVIVIGDTISDVECAQAIGAKVIACCTGFHSRDELAAANPCAIVEDLTDIPTLMGLFQS
jgi:phosphoglycolate phosphatase